VSSDTSAVAATAAAAAAAAPPAEATTAPPTSKTIAWAPIKREFLLQLAPVANDEPAGSDAGAAASAADDATSSGATKRKFEGGVSSWTKRTGAARGPRAEPHELCRSVAQGKPCARQASCHRLHDVAQFLATRAPDLEGVCPSFAKHGACAFGVACRFVGSHLAPDGVSSLVEQRADASPPAPAFVLSIEQQRAIERRHVKTPRTDAFWSVRDSPDTDVTARLRAGEVKAVDFRGKTILAPLTTVGHMAFRRICKGFGADVTVSEMALAHELQHGNGAEWALLKRHACEDVFGVQLACGSANIMAQAIEIMRDHVGASCDYISLNAGCPLDMLCNHGGGAQLCCAPPRLRQMARSMVAVADVPIEVKIRTGRVESEQIAHTYLADVHSWGVSAVTLHGRSRRTRYTEPANRDYMLRCAAVSSVPFIANGDVYSFEDAVELWRPDSNVAGIMIGRAALIKPWIFQEIKERRHIDISANERLDTIRQFCHNGLELFGSDARGVEKTRTFLCEWLSFAHRYVPVGILERMPSRIHEKPAPWHGRSELETLLGSPAVADWIKISGMFLGNPPAGFSFQPKHKSQAYDTSDVIQHQHQQRGAGNVDDVQG